MTNKFTRNYSNFTETEVKDFIARITPMFPSFTVHAEKVPTRTPEDRWYLAVLRNGYCIAIANNEDQFDEFVAACFAVTEDLAPREQSQQVAIPVVSQ